VLLTLLGRVLTWLLPGGGTRRRTVPMQAAGPVAPPPRARPRSPYAREAAADHRVDVSDEPLTRPYYRYYGATESMCAG
jgi:hypothetical protein